MEKHKQIVSVESQVDDYLNCQNSLALAATTRKLYRTVGDKPL